MKELASKLLSVDTVRQRAYSLQALLTMDKETLAGGSPTIEMLAANKCLLGAILDFTPDKNLAASDYAMVYMELFDNLRYNHRLSHLAEEEKLGASKPASCACCGKPLITATRKETASTSSMLGSCTRTMIAKIRRRARSGKKRRNQDVEELRLKVVIPRRKGSHEDLALAPISFVVRSVVRIGCDVHGCAAAPLDPTPT